MLERLRSTSGIEWSVGIGFSLVGFFLGSLLIGNTLNRQKINLELPKEATETESRPYLGELNPKRQVPQVLKPERVEIQQLPKNEQSSVPSPEDVDEFKNLSQEEKNCVIWKNAHPEAAYKLKKGDACY